MLRVTIPWCSCAKTHHTCGACHFILWRSEPGNLTRTHTTFGSPLHKKSWNSIGFKRYFCDFKDFLCHTKTPNCFDSLKWKADFHNDIKYCSRFLVFSCFWKAWTRVVKKVRFTSVYDRFWSVSLLIIFLFGFENVQTHFILQKMSSNSHNHFGVAWSLCITYYFPS